MFLLNTIKKAPVIQIKQPKIHLYATILLMWATFRCWFRCFSSCSLDGNRKHVAINLLFYFRFTNLPLPLLKFTMLPSSNNFLLNSHLGFGVNTSRTQQPRIGAAGRHHCKTIHLLLTVLVISVFGVFTGLKWTTPMLIKSIWDWCAVFWILKYV